MVISDKRMCGQGCLFTQYCRLDNSFLGAFGPHKPHLGILGACWYILSPLLGEKEVGTIGFGPFLTKSESSKVAFFPIISHDLDFLGVFLGSNWAHRPGQGVPSPPRPGSNDNWQKNWSKRTKFGHFRPFLQFCPTSGGSKCMNRRSVGKTALVPNPPRFGEPVEPLNSFSIVGPNVCVESHCVCCWLYTQWL